MACKDCGSPSGAEVCLHCGHEFCSKHRDEAGGVPACYDCIKAEAERKRARPTTGASPKPPPPSDGPIQVQLQPAPPPTPLPEPRGNLMPLAAGVLVGAPSAGYLYWLFGKLALEHEWPGLVQPVGSSAFGLFVLAGVFAIVKSR